jgi:ATP-dependent exoDNAse (exonuclease V) beta subunit
VTGAAGVAWERAAAPSVRDEEGLQCHDWAELLEATPSRHDAETCVRAAAALLAGLGAAHARVTRALLERDLGPADIAALARGERPSADDGA